MTPPRPTAIGSHPLRRSAVTAAVLGVGLAFIAGCTATATPIVAASTAAATPTGAPTSPGGSPTPTTAPTTPLATASSPTRSTAGWTRYSNPADQFSLRYPPSWQHRTCAVSGHTSLYLGPTAAAVGICSSGYVGQMYVTPLAGDQRATLTLGAEYGDRTSHAVTVAGVTGVRESATVVATMGIGPEPGTKIVQYTFFVHGRTYLCYYSQAINGPTIGDVQADFDAVVTHTLAFTG